MQTFFSALDVSITTFNISFESIQYKQQYSTKITCTKIRKKVYGGFKILLELLEVLTYSPP